MDEYIEIRYLDRYPYANSLELPSNLGQPTPVRMSGGRSTTVWLKTPRGPGYHTHAITYRPFGDANTLVQHTNVHASCQQHHLYCLLRSFLRFAFSMLIAFSISTSESITCCFIFNSCSMTKQSGERLTRTIRVGSGGNAGTASFFSCLLVTLAMLSRDECDLCEAYGCVAFMVREPKRARRRAVAHLGGDPTARCY